MLSWLPFRVSLVRIASKISEPRNSCVTGHSNAGSQDRIARVPGLVSVARGKAIAVTSLALMAGAFGAGCDTQETADLERGRDLFTEKCGTCHALTEARTAADIG